MEYLYEKQWQEVEYLECLLFEYMVFYCYFKICIGYGFIDFLEVIDFC